MGRKNNYHLDNSRVVVHLDIDCFHVQLLYRQKPNLRGQPCVVTNNSQYPTSVNYEARQLWPTNLWGDFSRSKAYQHIKQWQQLNPELNVEPFEPNKHRRKPHKQMSKRLYDVISDYLLNNHQNVPIIEFSSLDELYIDLTDVCRQYLSNTSKYTKSYLKSLNARVEGTRRQFNFGDEPSLKRLAITEGVVIVANILAEIKSKTGLDCSAGISFNKLLAKIGCNLNKPKGITVLIGKEGIARISQTLPIHKIEGLGGIKGHKVMDDLIIRYMKDMRQYRRQQLIGMFGRELALWEKCRGIDNTPVQFKRQFKEIDCSHQLTVNCNSRNVNNYLLDICNRFTSSLRSQNLIVRQLRVECYSLAGLNSYATIELTSNTYDPQIMFDRVKNTGFPHMGGNAFTCIKGFRLIAIDPTSDHSMDQIIRQTQRLNINH